MVEIAPEVIEAAAKAITDHRFPGGSGTGIGGQHAREVAEAAIRAADEKRGLKEERMDRVDRSPGASHSHLIPEVRLVSDWVEVKDD